MDYTYYPGCSLEGSAREYDLSTRALMAALGAGLRDIEDWTCCGASAAESCSRLLALALPARNLALAEAMKQNSDILVPCSACYLNLKKVENAIKKDLKTRQAIRSVLEEEGLAIESPPGVRHLLDVLVRDIGAERIGSMVQRPLAGMTVAPYYGCQCLRPYPVFDDPEQPRSMEPLIAATGATVHPWPMGGKCCGAAHMSTKPAVGMALVAAILEAARGADAVVTVCPMCQMNLEGYQKKISAARGVPLQVTVLYLPQLLGLALGLPGSETRLDLNLAVTGSFQSKFSGLVSPEPAAAPG